MHLATPPTQRSLPVKKINRMWRCQASTSKRYLRSFFRDRRDFCHFILYINVILSVSVCNLLISSYCFYQSIINIIIFWIREKRQIQRHIQTFIFSLRRINWSFFERMWLVSLSVSLSGFALRLSSAVFRDEHTARRTYVLGRWLQTCLTTRGHIDSSRAHAQKKPRDPLCSLLSLSLNNETHGGPLITSTHGTRRYKQVVPAHVAGYDV